MEKEEFNKEKMKRSQAIIDNETLIQPRENKDEAITSEMKDTLSTLLESNFIRWKDDSVSTCDLCKREIVLGKNLDGLVIDEKIFACEDCCRSVQKDELTKWSTSKMASPYSLRPIGRWLTQEKTKKRKTLSTMHLKK